jgi:hypothetical protein
MGAWSSYEQVVLAYRRKIRECSFGLRWYSSAKRRIMSKTRIA